MTSADKQFRYVGFSGWFVGFQDIPSSVGLQPSNTCHWNVVNGLDKWSSEQLHFVWWMKLSQSKIAFAPLVSNYCPTPLKINMEHNHVGLVQIIFLSKWVVCRFQPLIFKGVLKNCKTPKNTKSWKFYSTLRHSKLLFLWWPPLGLLLQKFMWVYFCI